MDALTLQRLDAISKEIGSLRHAFSKSIRDTRYEVVASRSVYTLQDNLNTLTLGHRSQLSQIVVFMKGLGIDPKQVIFNI